MKRRIAVWLIIMMLMGGMMFVLNTSGDANDTNSEMKSVSVSQSKSYASHDPICIDSNLGFNYTNGVSSGSGTAIDPYIIENWDINASTADGIDIRNTNKYFIIRNCVVHDGYNNEKHGIYFHTVSNGKIESCEIYNNGYGIYFDSSSNNAISANNVRNNHIFILYSSNNNIISGNHLYNYSMLFIQESSYNTISANYVCNTSGGMVGIALLFSSNNNIISGNYVYDNSSVSLQESSNNTIIANYVYNAGGVCPLALRFFK